MVLVEYVLLNVVDVDLFVLASVDYEKSLSWLLTPEKNYVAKKFMSRKNYSLVKKYFIKLLTPLFL